MDVQLLHVYRKPFTRYPKCQAFFEGLAKVTLGQIMITNPHLELLMGGGKKKAPARDHLTPGRC